MIFPGVTTVPIGLCVIVLGVICYNAEDARSDVRAFSGRTGQLVFCSTVDVFTKTVRNYAIMENNERNPSVTFPYAYNKAICEKIFEKAQDEKAFPLTILRPTATYNNTSTPISFIGQGTALLKRIRRGMPVIVLGDGLSIWVSSHRDDVGNAFVGAKKKKYGYSYEVARDNNDKVMDIFHSQCKEHGIASNDNDIFINSPDCLQSPMHPK